MASLYRRVYGAKSGKKTTRWWGKYADANGVVRRVSLASDKSAASTMLNELVRKAELQAIGVVDPFEDSGRIPLTAHVSAFEADLAARGNTSKHVRLTTARLQAALIDGCRFRLLADLNGARLLAWLAEQRKADVFGVKTSNYHLQACRSFGTWLVKDRRIAQTPFAHLAGVNARTDVRLTRRAMTADEAARLIQAARQSADVVRGLSGADRAALYKLALETGFRVQELASLTTGSFNMAGSPPSIVIQAAYSKRRREDIQPIRSGFALELQAWLQTRFPQAGVRNIVAMRGNASQGTPERLFSGSWAQHAAKMLHQDLARARQAWIAEVPPGAARQEREHDADFLQPLSGNGETLDFHSLRHTYITDLVSAGIAPKTCQSLARHSSIILTLDRYSHVQLHDVAGALESTPGPASTPERAQATGTYESVVPAVVPKLCPNSDIPGNNMILSDTLNNSEECNNPREKQGFLGDFEERRRGESNPRWRICNPLP